MSVTSALERIHQWAETHDPAFIALLQPGLTRQEIDAQIGGLPFALAEEVYELYQWRNGQKDGRFQLGLLQSFLYPLMSLKEALQEYTQFQAENFQIEVDEGYCDFLDSGGWLPVIGMESYYAATLGQPPAQKKSTLVRITRAGKTEAWYPSLTAMLEFRADLYEADAMRQKEGDPLLWWADYQIASALKRKHFPKQAAEAERWYTQYGQEDSPIADRYSLLATQNVDANKAQIEAREAQCAYAIRQLVLSGSQLALPVVEAYLQEQVESHELTASVLHDLLTLPLNFSEKWSPTQNKHVVGLAGSFQIN